jgi:hypothetical protein
MIPGRSEGSRDPSILEVIFFCILAGLILFLIMINFNSWFVTGYTDAEGCFLISIVRGLGSILGWRVQLEFNISALNNPANLRFLESLVSFFGGGRISLAGNQLYFRVLDLPTL